MKIIYLITILILFIRTYFSAAYNHWWYIGISAASQVFHQNQNKFQNFKNRINDHIPREGTSHKNTFNSKQKSFSGTLRSGDSADIMTRENFRRSGSGEDKCNSAKFLSKNQREICRRGGTNGLDVLAEGALMGIRECQHQFKHRRWNCTIYNDTNVFGKILETRGRETAYIYAISAAGVMHSITRACAKGEIENCGCDRSVHKIQNAGFWEWGGCSHDIKFGQRFAKAFVDTSEMKGRISDKRLMNLWNNGAGRKSISRNMRLVCKCHGVSGSCSVKICWRVMPNFRDVGVVLKRKFEAAAKVKLNRRKRRLKPVFKWQRKPTKQDLVYLEDSPDYCSYDPKWGSLGTTGRQCRRDSNDKDSCESLCCRRGYITRQYNEEYECKCKFHWCCKVECKKCSRTMVTNTCK